MVVGVALTLAFVGLATAVVVLVHAVAYRDAARRRPALEAVCDDHDEEPLPLGVRAGGFVAECLLSALLPTLGLFGPRPLHRTATASPRVPVVIVTPRWGRGLGWPLWAHLQRAGWSTIELASADRLITASLASIDAAVRRALATAPDARVDLVAFGAAGLVARIFASDPSTAVRQLVTVATPHHGTQAWWPFGGGAVAPGGALVRHADDAGSGRSDVACTALYSTDDPALLPATNAYLHGALAITVRGLGHVSTFAAPRVLSLIADALAEQDAATLPAAS